MKKTILLALLMLSSFSAGATAQTGDIIYIDGVEWQLLGKPLCLVRLFLVSMLASTVIAECESHKSLFLLFSHR